MKRYLFLVPLYGLFLVFGFQTKAQDIHFSQFYMAPLDLNPALTGVMNCNSRFLVNYRNQGATALNIDAYNTTSASYDQKMPVGRSDYFGFGANFWGDVAGELRFGTIYGKLSASYSKRLGGNRIKSHYLVFGADAGFGQGGLKLGLAKWSNQAVEGNHDPNIGGDILDFSNVQYFDIDAGLLWFSVLSKKSSFYFGAAMSHLNQPNLSLKSGAYVPIHTKYTVHSGGQFEVAPKIVMVPGFVLFSQGPHKQFNFGSSLRFLLGNSRLKNQSFQAGLWCRIGNKVEGNVHGDAIILSTRFNYEHFNFGLSYDVTVSLWRQANRSSGAFEFSLGYEICGNEKRKVYCPRF